MYIEQYQQYLHINVKDYIDIASCYALGAESRWKAGHDCMANRCL